MIRTAAATLAVLACAVASLDAQISIVSRTTIKAATPPPQPSPFLYAMFGEMMLGLVVPADVVDMTALVTEKGARIEYKQSTFGLPAGVVILVQPSGDVAILDSKERTYLKMTEEESTAMWSQLGAQPVTTHKRTGEFQTIAGVKAERVAFEWTWPYPLSPEEKAMLPPNAPEAIVLTGDAWVAVDKFKQYTSMAVRANAGLSSLGMKKILNEGIVLRSAIRSPTFAGKEIETIVTSVVEDAGSSGALTDSGRLQAGV